MRLNEALAECPVVAIVRGVRPDEVAAHQAYLERLKASSGRCLWLEQEPSA